MMNKNVIVIKNGETQVYSTLSALCKAKGWVYNTLRLKKYPFQHMGYTIDKLEIQRK